MLKAADALHDVGYSVRVVCAEHVDWCIAAGRKLRAKRSWQCDVLDWHWRTGRSTYCWSRLRHKAFRLLAAGVEPKRLSLGVLARAGCRVAPELIRVATREPADLIYAGTAGGLAVGALVARRLGIPYALDLEDFHTGEQYDCGTARRTHALMEAVESQILSRAIFLTAGSPPIAVAYAVKYGVHQVPVNNTFPLPSHPPAFHRAAGRPLQLFWFSQHVGPGRGLEDAVRAAVGLDQSVRLWLIGDPDRAYVARLLLLANANPNVELRVLPPCEPHELVLACQDKDVGLALEPGFSTNNEIALSNKLFTYMLGGLAVAATCTRGQLVPAADLGEGALYYRPGDVDALATGLKRWANDPTALERAKRASWEAAKCRWHWEHPLERGVLLDLVAGAIGKP
jgi:hypothetical protein